ncbi:hypothetical protein BpHYR1_042011, partial [Brachionus plicatilis]
NKLLFTYQGLSLKTSISLVLNFEKNGYLNDHKLELKLGLDACCPLFFDFSKKKFKSFAKSIMT